MADARQTTIDAAEVERFSALAAEWWNPNGKFRPLHKFNPVRLAYIRDQVAARFGRDPHAARPFEGLRFLDIGCGGGLLCEPMARLGAEVVGADASATNIEVAKLHAAEAGVTIDYRATTAEDLADAGEQFDVILNMEVVEHVSDVGLFVAKCGQMVKPGRHHVRRHHQPHAEGAGPGDHRRRICAALAAARHPSISASWFARKSSRRRLSDAGMAIIDRTGVIYNPLADRWQRSKDMDVNYMVLAEKRLLEPSPGQFPLRWARVVMVTPGTMISRTDPGQRLIAFAEEERARKQADGRAHIADLAEIDRAADRLQPEEEDEHRRRGDDLGDGQQRHTRQIGRTRRRHRKPAWQSAAWPAAARWLPTASSIGPASAGQSIVR